MPPFTNLDILLKPAEARLGLALIKSPIWQNLSFYQSPLFMQRSHNRDFCIKIITP
ncbi:hypothetical protein SPBRAN_1751 [uncultured Candidatus Thioglobus sp.]|nr:hypothetical protein SPBRAN_1751 [uncultured Candidatus Thioglobus sp.]